MTAGSRAGRPWCVALTGGIASGKSAAADHFAELGAAVVDTDRLSRQLTAPGGKALPAILAEFGQAVLDAAGGLDRAAMRQRVFDAPEARRRLEAILHPMIRAEAGLQTMAARGPYVVLVVPLLLESRGAYAPLVDRVLVVDCPVDLQVARACNRDRSDPERIRAIVDAQAGRKARLAIADDVIVNDAGLDDLRAQVDRLHRRYLELAAA